MLARRHYYSRGRVSSLNFAAGRILMRKHERDTITATRTMDISRAPNSDDEDDDNNDDVAAWGRLSFRRRIIIGYHRRATKKPRRYRPTDVRLTRNVNHARPRARVLMRIVNVITSSTCVTIQSRAREYTVFTHVFVRYCVDNWTVDVERVFSNVPRIE